MTPSQRIQAIKARVESATDSRWAADDQICSGCDTPVNVRAGCEWEDGDFCDACNTEIANHYREDIPFLLSRLEAAEQIMAIANDTVAQIMDQKMIWPAEVDTLAEALSSYSGGGDDSSAL